MPFLFYVSITQRQSDGSDATDNAVVQIHLDTQTASVVAKMYTLAAAPVASVGGGDIQTLPFFD